jgi:hypothetical protein
MIISHVTTIPHTHTTIIIRFFHQLFPTLKAIFLFTTQLLIQLHQLIMEIFILLPTQRALPTQAIKPFLQDCQIGFF